MKKQLSVFIVNPANGVLVTVAKWRNTENPTSAEFVAIVREDKSGFIFAKDPVKVDGEINFKWDKAFELATKFKPTTEIANLGIEGFHLPDRRESLEIYEARFQGLDKALALIGGTPLYEGDANWMWTGDEDPDPECGGNSAFLLNGCTGAVINEYKHNILKECTGSVINEYKGNVNTVRPISAFTQKKEFFPITSVSRDDLEAKGFDTSDITDIQMEHLASKMADDYLEQMYWISMEIIAENLGFPKK